jgi:thioredoxin-like negative regulator of GroEL
VSERGETERPITLSSESELDATLDAHSIVLLELYTDGCGLCASMEPVLTNVARTSEATVARVNPRDDPPLIDRFDVRSVPTFVLFVDGERVAERADGYVAYDELLDWIETATA